MGDFLDVAGDLLRSNRVDQKRAQFERVFAVIDDLQVVHSKAQFDLTNIESIFTALELGNIIQRVPGLTPEEIPLTISALKELIVETLQATINFPSQSNYIDVPIPYKSFAELLVYIRTQIFPTQSASVISFNYDIAADMALYRGQMGPHYGIGSGPPNCQNPIHLLKLHGSLNWATEKNSSKIYPLHLHDYLNIFQLRTYNTRSDIQVPIGNHLVEYYSRNGIEVNPEPVIVPPSWNKADYHHALSDIWAAAAKHLSEAEYIFIIGYSLPETDSFFRHLYTLGSVGKASLRRFIVFNPDKSGDVDARFRRLLGPGAISRYEYRDIDFQASISEIKSFFPKRK